MICLGLSLNRANGAAGSGHTPVVTGPVSFSFGAKTLSGVGEGLSDRILGSIAGSVTALTLGSQSSGGDHFAAIGATLETTARPTDPAYVWTGCTLEAYGGVSDAFDITVATVAGAYSVGSDSEFAAAVGDSDPGDSFMAVRGYAIPAPVVAAALASRIVTEGSAIAPVDTSPAFAVIGDPTLKTVGFALAPGSEPLPAGLDFDPVTGVLSGTPTATGTAVLSILATNQAGSAETTLDIEIAAAPEVPAQVTGLIGVAGDGRVDLSWLAPADGGAPVTDYVIERSVSGGAFAVLADGVSSATAFADTGAVNGVTHSYRVAAVNAVGAGPVSAPASGVPLAPPSVPDPVAGLVAIPGDALVSLTWQAPADGGAPIIDYIVERSVGGGAFAVVADGQGTGTSFVDTGAQNGAVHAYRVAAVNAVGTGGNSAVANAVPMAPATAPEAVPGLLAIAGNGQVSLTWQAPGDGGTPVTDYRIERSISGGAFAVIDDGVGTQTAFVDTGLGNGVVHAYRVAAVNVVGTGPVSAPVSTVPVAPATAPAQVTGVNATGGNSQISLTWQAPDNGGASILDYIIERSVSGGTFAVVADGFGTSTSFVDTGRPNGVVHAYRVSAVNSVGTSTASLPVSAVPVAPAAVPAQVSGLVAVAGNAQVSLTWQVPADGGAPISDYIVERSVAGGAFVVVSDGVGTGTSFVDTGRTNGVVHAYRVSAVNSVGQGASSSSASAVPVAPPQVPAQLSGLIAFAGNGQVSLSWQAPDDRGAAITDYVIERSIAGGGFGVIADGIGAGTSFVDTGRANGVIHAYRVAAVNAIGTGAVSASVSATPQDGTQVTNTANTILNLGRVAEFTANQPFLNRAKTQRGPIIAGGRSVRTHPALFDANGWVRNLGGAADWATGLGFFQETLGPSDFTTWRVRWRSLSQGGSAFTFSSLSDVSFGPITAVGGGVFERILTVSSNADGQLTMRSTAIDVDMLECVRTDLTGLFDAGEVFHPSYLDFLAPLVGGVRTPRFKALRPMFWSGVNTEFGTGTAKSGIPARHFSDLPTAAAATYGQVLNRVPVEIMVRLCNETNTHLYYNFPVDLSDAAIAAVADQVRDTLNPGLTFFFAFGNESGWNTAGNFDRTGNQAFAFAARDGWLTSGDTGVRPTFTQGSSTAVVAGQDISDIVTPFTVLAVQDAAGDWRGVKTNGNGATFDGTDSTLHFQYPWPFASGLSQSNIFTRGGFGELALKGNMHAKMIRRIALIVDASFGPSRRGDWRSISETYFGNTTQTTAIVTNPTIWEADGGVVPYANPKTDPMIDAFSHSSYWGSGIFDWAALQTEIQADPIVAKSYLQDYLLNNAGNFSLATRRGQHRAAREAFGDDKLVVHYEGGTHLHSKDTPPSSQFSEAQIAVISNWFRNHWNDSPEQVSIQDEMFSICQTYGDSYCQFEDVALYLRGDGSLIESFFLRNNYDHPPLGREARLDTYRETVGDWSGDNPPSVIFGYQPPTGWTFFDAQGGSVNLGRFHSWVPTARRIYSHDGPAGITISDSAGGVSLSAAPGTVLPGNYSLNVSVAKQGGLAGQATIPVSVEVLQDTTSYGRAISIDLGSVTGVQPADRVGVAIDPDTGQPYAGWTLLSGFPNFSVNGVADEEGQLTGLAIATVGGTGNFTSNSVDDGTADYRMYVRGFGISPGGTTMTLSNIPFAKYDIFVYVDGAGGNVAALTAADGPDAAVTYHRASPGSAGIWQGSYQRAESENPAAPSTTGNYLLFKPFDQAPVPADPANRTVTLTGTGWIAVGISIVERTD